MNGCSESDATGIGCALALARNTRRSGRDGFLSAASIDAGGRTIVSPLYRLDGSIRYGSGGQVRVELRDASTIAVPEDGELQVDVRGDLAGISLRYRSKANGPPKERAVCK